MLTHITGLLREAIIGGGKFNADDYIRIGQKTMNLIRYNTLPKLYGKHQYGTAISMAKTEAELYHKAYKEIGTLNTKFVFLIPVFNS
jgi:beta-N-acetylglucosaminidase